MQIIIMTRKYMYKYHEKLKVRIRDIVTFIFNFYNISRIRID